MEIYFTKTICCFRTNRNRSRSPPLRQDPLQNNPVVSASNRETVRSVTSRTNREPARSTTNRTSRDPARPAVTIRADREPTCTDRDTRNLGEETRVSSQNRLPSNAPVISSASPEGGTQDQTNIGLLQASSPVSSRVSPNRNPNRTRLRERTDTRSNNHQTRPQSGAPLVSSRVSSE